MLAEFVYGLKPQETFAKYGLDQVVPRKYVPSPLTLSLLPVLGI